MMYIRNTQRTVPIDLAQVNIDLGYILTAVKYPNFIVSVWFSTEKTIRKYNMQFRAIDKPTDVLSFPYHVHAKPGIRIVAKNEEDKNLGDILIAPTYVQRQAIHENQTFEERLRIILVHSVCHLLGYDHSEDA